MKPQRLGLGVDIVTHLVSFNNLWGGGGGGGGEGEGQRGSERCQGA